MLAGKHYIGTMKQTTNAYALSADVPVFDRDDLSRKRAALHRDRRNTDRVERALSRAQRHAAADARNRRYAA